jgi:hypothetical protein
VTRPRAVAQAWVELCADDPEAVSALHVARTHLDAGRALAGLRRFRLFELAGALPDRAGLEERLHRSTQFYNPHKERCVVRVSAGERPPAAGPALLVSERGLERRAAAERWWRHAGGGAIEVREGIVWAFTFAAGTSSEAAAAAAESLAVVRDRAHGMFCNPHAQDGSLAGTPPLPWLTPAPRRPARRTHGADA